MTESRSAAGQWGIGWFLWNLPLAIVLILAVYAAWYMGDSVVTGEAFHVTEMISSMIWAGTPVLIPFVWFAGSGLIAAICALGVRKKIVLRMLVAAVPLVPIFLMAENLWITGYLATISCMFGAIARLPRLTDHMVGS